MRGIVCALVAIAGVAFAQEEDQPAKKEKAPSVFDTPPPGIGGWPGTRARYAEELARVEARLQAQPADVDALLRLGLLASDLGRAKLMEPVARAMLERKDLTGKLRNLVRGELGVAIVARINETSRFGNMIIIINGRRQQFGGGALDPKDRAELEKARDHLRAAQGAGSRSPTVLEALAGTLERLQRDPNEVNEEAEELRTQVEALLARDRSPPPPDDVYRRRANTLVTEAVLLEQAQEGPDHVRALEKRKEALVHEFCADTIVFDYTPSLYRPIALLADRELLQSYLTRTYISQAGDSASVPPKIHTPSIATRQSVIAALGKDGTNGADAVLLRLVRARTAFEEPVSLLAARELAADGHDAAKDGITRLLARALFAGDTRRFPLAGQRALVHLAVAMDAKLAAPVLAGAVERDTQTRWPRDIAWAVGHLGGTEQAAPLLRVALDRARDLHFRREAARAYVRLMPDEATRFDAIPELALAVAAGLYAVRPDEDLRGRILNGFSDPMLVDEAARYCADLAIREALPTMEDFLRTYGQKKDHVARLVVERARARLAATGS
ncbi:MAG: hypothetical protein AAGD14_03300 [Planctomycetota bacterium]